MGSSLCSEPCLRFWTHATGDNRGMAGFFSELILDIVSHVLAKAGPLVGVGGIPL